MARVGGRGDRPRAGDHVRQSKPQGSSIQILKRMLGLFAPFQGQFVAVIVLVVVTVALSLTPALLLGEIVDEATSDGTAKGDRSRIIVLASIGVGVYIAAGLLGVLRAYVTQIIGQGVMYNLRLTLHAHLQRLSVRFFTNTKTGEILSRVMTDVTGIQQVLTGTFTEFFTNIITLGLPARRHAALLGLPDDSRGSGPATAAAPMAGGGRRNVRPVGGDALGLRLDAGKDVRPPGA